MTLAALLLVAASCGGSDPTTASAASLRAPGRHPACSKAAGKHRAVRERSARKGGRRSCGRSRTRHSGQISEQAQSAPRGLDTTAIEPASGPATAAPGPEKSLEPSTTEPLRLFSPTSVWNAPVADDAPLDPNSAALVGAFGDEIERERPVTGGPAINTTAFSVPIYTVPADQPTVKVALRPGSSAEALRSAWNKVPLPPTAHPAAGTDAHLVLWQPSSDKLWEFWRLSGGPGSWQAGWGGAMNRVSSSSGVYGPEAWPGATRWWGASASSLSIAGGLITLEDLERDKIDHALALAVPNVRAGVYSLPAQRTDGKSHNPMSLPEGAHLRLDPSLNLADMHLPHMTLLIAEAAQRYGLILRDGSSTVCLYAQDPTPTGTNPFAGPGGYLTKTPKPLAFFPWRHLQLLRMTLRQDQ